MKKTFWISLAALFATSFAYAGNVNNVVLKANKIGAEIKPTMYGHKQTMI